MNPKVVLIFSFFVIAGCGSSDDAEPPLETNDGQLVATVGEDETVLAGDPGTQFEGVRLVIPAGAIEVGTEVKIETTSEIPQPLPDGAFSVGPLFRIAPESLDPSAPLELTLPYDHEVVINEYSQAPVSVKVWQHKPQMEDGWAKLAQMASTESTVTIMADELTTYGAGVWVE